MKRKLLSLGLVLSISACSNINPADTKSANLSSPDWQAIPLPAQLAEAHQWQPVEFISDDFNYEQKNKAFYQKWYDNHIRGWKGPGATYFSADHSFIENGKLVLTAASVPANQQGKTIDYGNFKTKKTIYTGFVTAKQNIEYPIYVEASLKVSSLALANNFWMLSDDDRNEIDVTETYGDSDKTVTHMSTNYHIFKRDPVTNDYLEDYGHKQQFATTADKAKLNQDFHRFGFFWKSPKYMEFYLDGKLVRTLTDKDDLNDPDGHFMDRGMRIIFDMEDHVWRARKGITPSETELLDPSKNKMFVDWIRAYKPNL